MRCSNRRHNLNTLIMLLQKTLHMSQSAAECKTRLSSIQSYRRHFVMVTKATVTSSKTVDFSFRGPFGFEARTVLLAAESASPDQFAFESTGGNIDLMGIVDFSEITPRCTEVTLAVHYEIKNKLFAWLDRRFKFVDSFLNLRDAQRARTFRRRGRPGPGTRGNGADVRDGDSVKFR